jgi:hypothetical protein
MQFAINHLGHFALAVGLHDALRAAGSARIVSVSSSAHLRSPVVFDDIQFASRAYEPLLAYGQSKTANVLFVVGATKRWADDGITANALLPGAIATDFQCCIGSTSSRALGRKVTARDGSRRPSRARRPPCCWRHRRGLRASAVAVSRTATKRSSSRSTARALAASRPTPSIPTTRTGSGRRRCGSSATRWRNRADRVSRSRGIAERLSAAARRRTLCRMILRYDRLGIEIPAGDPDPAGARGAGAAGRALRRDVDADELHLWRISNS